MATTTSRTDLRTPGQQITDHVQVFTYIGGLCLLLVVWSLIAWRTIGDQALHRPDYYLPNPVPASEPYNVLQDFQRPHR